MPSIGPWAWSQKPWMDKPGWYSLVPPSLLESKDVEWFGNLGCGCGDQGSHLREVLDMPVVGWGLTCLWLAVGEYSSASGGPQQSESFDGNCWAFAHLYVHLWPGFRFHSRNEYTSHGNDGDHTKDFPGQFHLSLTTTSYSQQGKDNFPYVPGRKQNPEALIGCNFFQGQGLIYYAGRTLKILIHSTVHIAWSMLLL